MIATTAAYKTAMQGRVQKWTVCGTLYITKSGTTTEYELTGNNFVEGSLSLDLQNNQGEGVTFGDVNAGSLECTLTNLPVGVSRSDFANAGILMKCGIYTANNIYELITLQYFNIQEARWVKEGVQITGYDGMTKLDIPFDASIVTATPHTPAYWYHALCEATGVVDFYPGTTSWSWCVNGTRNFNIYNAAETIKTWRDFLYYLCQVIGCFAKMDWTALELCPYKTITDVSDVVADVALIDTFSVADGSTLLSGFNFIENDGYYTYYGVDSDRQTAQKASLTRLLDEQQEALDKIEQEIDANEEAQIQLRIAYEQGRITIDEFNAQSATLGAQYLQLSLEASAKDATIDAVDEAKRAYGTTYPPDPGFEGAGYINIPFNPFLGLSSRLQSICNSNLNAARWAIGSYIATYLQYTAFECSMLGHAGFEPGDSVGLQFQGSDHDRGLIIGTTYDGYTLQLRGWGGSDKLQTVTSGANTAVGNAVNAVAQDVAQLKDQMDSVSANVSDGKELIAGAITGRGVYTSAELTFPEMAANINKIETGGNVNGAIEHRLTARSYAVGTPPIAQKSTVTQTVEGHAAYHDLFTYTSLPHDERGIIDLTFGFRPVKVEIHIDCVDGTDRDLYYDIYTDKNRSENSYTWYEQVSEIPPVWEPHTTTYYLSVTSATPPNNAVGIVGMTDTGCKICLGGSYAVDTGATIRIFAV